MSRVSLTALLAGALLIASALAQEHRISGIVVDQEGAPAPGVEVGTYWEIAGDDAISVEGEVTDEEGAFLLTLDRARVPLAVLALDLEGGRAGLAEIATADQLGTPLHIRLHDTSRVQGQVRVPALDSQPGWCRVLLQTREQARLALCISNQAGFVLPAPPGRYLLRIWGEDARSLTHPIQVPAGEEVVDLGTMELQPTVIAMHRGKEPPPLTLVGARGVGPDVQPAAYQGRWLYLEFWGSWCVPCTRDVLPRLIELQERFAPVQEQFQVLAIHDDTLESMEDLEEKLGELRARAWKGKDLPFPVLLDTGDTLERYGIESVPTGVLVDPEGHVVGMAHPQLLQARLETLEKEPSDE